MRQTIDLCQGWQFTGFDGKTIEVNVPHTWNNIDGQDGGNDYKRGSCRYERSFVCPTFDRDSEEVWLEFDGVNASATVTVNGREVCVHDGGYSTFRVNVTPLLAETNDLVVIADNSKNDRGYPQ